MRFLNALGLAGLMLLGAPGCDQRQAGKSESAKEKPAKVESLPNEAHLAEIELTESASKRLGITLATATIRDVSEVRQLGGEVLVPPGESAVVVAPVAGTVQPPDESAVPKPGTAVAKGQVVFKFEPLLTPERFVPTPAERAQIANAQASLISLQMAADGDVRQFTEQVTAARIGLNRAEQLQRDRVGSERAVDDAKAQLAIAEAGLKVARERKEVLNKLSSDMAKATATPTTFASPIDGILRTLPVTLGQTVAAGTTLFEVVNLDEIWIRVPVYVGLLDELRTNDPVTVTFFGHDAKRDQYRASPVAAPPAADPLSSTADLYYRIQNDTGRFRPGERVSVALPLTTKSRAIVVPAKAILYDIFGNTWVYEKTGDLHFRRSRVLLERTTEEFAVLRGGLPQGTEVVVDGAAELFGTEFGTGK